jgi:hypothetical protein
LRAQALDAAGNPVPAARLRFAAEGGRFEAEVDTLGLVRSGAAGTLPVSIVATVPGARPVVHRVDVRMTPGPATRVVADQPLLRLAVGQEHRLTANVFSATGDVRLHDRVTWGPGRASVASVDAAGMVRATGPGRTRITASAGEARAAVEVTVVPQRVASLEISSIRLEARQGHVIRFRALARTSTGAAVEGLATNWSFAPGSGTIAQDGSFAAYEPGDYVITAVQGNRTAQSVLRVGTRDVRRAMSVVGRLPRTRFRTEELWIHPDGKHA